MKLSMKISKAVREFAYTCLVCVFTGCIQMDDFRISEKSVRAIAIINITRVAGARAGGLAKPIETSDSTRLGTALAMASISI